MFLLFMGEIPHRDTSTTIALEVWCTKGGMDLVCDEGWTWLRFELHMNLIFATWGEGSRLNLLAGLALHTIVGIPGKIHNN